MPKLEQDRADLDDRIASLRAAIAAWEAISGKRPRKSPTPASAESAEAIPSHPIKRGQVAQHIDAILKAGGDYDEPDLRKAIFDRFNVVYGRPTIYSALRRGRKIGRYEQKEKRWRMKVA
ncbi:MAG: hypothetical protein ACE5JD_00055 [Candidatus Methylomirabilia bacterium]